MTSTPQRTKLLEYWGASLPCYACIYRPSEISSFTVVENVFMLTIRVLTQTAKFLYLLINTRVVEHDKCEWVLLCVLCIRLHVLQKTWYSEHKKKETRTMYIHFLIFSWQIDASVNQCSYLSLLLANIHNEYSFSLMLDEQR